MLVNKTSQCILGYEIENALKNYPDFLHLIVNIYSQKKLKKTFQNTNTQQVTCFKFKK